MTIRRPTRRPFDDLRYDH